MVYPSNLESEYEAAVEKMIELIDKEYLQALKKLKPDTFEQRINQSIFSKARKMLADIRKRIDKKRIVRAMEKTIKNVMKDIDRIVSKNVRSLFRQAKQEIPETVLTRESVEAEAAVRDNVALIGAIKNKHSENLEKVITKSLIGGFDPKIIEEEIEAQSKRGKAYATFVARDQISKAAGSINRERQRSSGIPGYRWVATKDPPRVRPSHLAQDGHFYQWDKPPLVGGKRLHPGEDFQCRCVAVASFGE